MKRFSLVCLALCLCLLTGSVLAQDTNTADEATDNELVHQVRPGDTLYRIGLRYGVSVQELVEHNALSNNWLISVGQRLRIPGLSDPSLAEDVYNPLIAPPAMQHTVRYGETLATIAASYGLTLDQVMRMNDLANPDFITAGEVLQIWTVEAQPDAVEAAPDVPEIIVEPATPTPLPTPTSVPTVAPEPEATADVSVETETTPEAESAAETAAEATEVTTDAPDLLESDEPIVHLVQPGEVLSAIARNYGVDWAQIAAENNLTNPNNIRVGQALRIPGTRRPPIDTSNLNLITDVLDEPGAKVGSGRELVVDISQQRAYAYEDGELIHAATVSTGLPATPTVTGSFRIYRKYDSQTMSGPGYWLPNVQWVMYFYAAYAFHTAYWHDNFGQPESHGCVNMRLEDARFFYDFAAIGTPVHVQL